MRHFAITVMVDEGHEVADGSIQPRPRTHTSAGTLNDDDPLAGELGAALAECVAATTPRPTMVLASAVNALPDLGGMRFDIDPEEGRLADRFYEAARQYVRFWTRYDQEES